MLSCPSITLSATNPIRIGAWTYRGLLCDTWRLPTWDVARPKPDSFRGILFNHRGHCNYFNKLLSKTGTRWHSWLGHCATSRKVAVSIPHGFNGIFHCHNPSGRSMALELTQSLTEKGTRNISWGVKAAGALGWQPYHFHVPIVLKCGRLTFLEPSGPVQACNGIVLPFYLANQNTNFPDVT